MHRVLFIQEILLNVFDHCLLAGPHDANSYSADLAVLARTCRTFREPALDLLWRELFDLSPLARCLPEACELNGRCYAFSRPLNKAEWNILRGYTRRVRSIRQHFQDRDSRIADFIEKVAEPLFPNLRSLYWADLGKLPVVNVIVPSLTSLSLNLLYLRATPPQVDLLNTLRERCPNIRQFTALCPHGELVHATISRQLSQWKDLQYVNCHEVILTIDSVLDLPSLSTLKRLSFALSADLGSHTTHLGSALVFSDLAVLSVSSTSLKSVTTFFSRIQLPKIMDLSVFVSEYTPKLDMQQYWAAVQRACPLNTLAHLAFSSVFQDEAENLPGRNGHGRPCLTLHDLLPFKDFGNLRKIEIDVAWSVNLTDSDLLDLVSTSPELERLYINSHWGWKMDGEGGITLSGLVQLLRQCPSLHTACFMIDTRTFTRIPHGLDASFPPRRNITRKLVLDCLDSNKFGPGCRSVFKSLDLSVLRGGVSHCCWRS